MFRRKWCGLPADPSYPSNLKDLGYFVNENDEIRSVEDPKLYFKYFITKNDRWNDRQRFGFHEGCQKVVLDRLATFGLRKSFLLPHGGNPDRTRHTFLYMSSDIATKSRVVVFIGESDQDLGILAHRVLGGKGGINEGSVINFVRSILRQRCSLEDPSPPGILLTNPGQLYWWPEGWRPLSPRQRHDIPMTSAVHKGWFYDPARNAIPENMTPEDHIRYIFKHVVPEIMRSNVKLDVVAVSDAANAVQTYLNNDPVWAQVGPLMNTLSLVHGEFDSQDLVCDGFRRFLRERTRAFINRPEPLGTPIAGPEGNPRSYSFTNYGCPVFSGGEANLSELGMISARPAVQQWIQEVALTEGEYKNPEFDVAIDDVAEMAEDMREGWESVEAQALVPALNLVDVEGGKITQSAPMDIPRENLESQEQAGQEPTGNAKAADAKSKDNMGGAKAVERE